MAKEIGESVFVKAKEVKVGDNVWGHNIVTSIKDVEDHQTDKPFVLFNGENVSAWIAEPNLQVMVTNR